MNGRMEGGNGREPLVARDVAAAPTLGVAEEQELQAVRVVDGDASAGHLAAGVLQVAVLHRHGVGQVERAVGGAAGRVHGLQVDQPGGRHQQHVALVIAEHEAHVADLAARQHEVVHRAEGVRGQIVDLQGKLPFKKNRSLSRVIYVKFPLQLHQ